MCDVAATVSVAMTREDTRTERTPASRPADVTIKRLDFSVIGSRPVPTRGLYHLCCNHCCSLIGWADSVHATVEEQPMATMKSMSLLVIALLFGAASPSAQTVA